MARRRCALGLATRVSEQPRDDALALAREIAARSPQAVRGAKALLNLAGLVSLEEGFKAESATIGALIGSPNQVEAIMASSRSESLASATDSGGPSAGIPRLGASGEYRRVNATETVGARHEWQGTGRSTSHSPTAILLPNPRSPITPSAGPTAGGDGWRAAPPSSSWLAAGPSRSPSVNAGAASPGPPRPVPGEEHEEAAGTPVTPVVGRARAERRHRGVGKSGKRQARHGQLASDRSRRQERDRGLRRPRQHHPGRAGQPVRLDHRADVPRRGLPDGVLPGPGGPAGLGVGRDRRDAFRPSPASTR